MLCNRGLQACRENVFGREDRLKKSWDLQVSFHIYLCEINAPCWHVLMILPFLDWDIRESFRKEKAWLKSANWNKIFAYNRDLVSAWAIHFFKTKMQPYTILDFTLFVKFGVPTDCVQWFVHCIWQLGLVFDIAFPTCLILRLQNSLWKLMELFICHSSLTQSCSEGRVTGMLNATL